MTWREKKSQLCDAETRASVSSNRPRLTDLGQRILPTGTRPDRPCGAHLDLGEYVGNYMLYDLSAQLGPSAPHGIVTSHGMIKASGCGLWTQGRSLGIEHQLIVYNIT